MESADVARRAHRARSSSIPAANDSEFEPDFESVLRAAKAGERTAFDQLFLRLNQRLHAYLRSRGAMDAEGMANEVFLRVFSGIKSFEGNENQFRAWLFTIARNKLIDEKRRLQRRPDEVLSDEINPDRAGDAELDALASLGSDWVRTQLDALTPDQRDVLLLRIVSDLTVDAVAEVIGKEPSAVKALQRRALRTLARRLNDEAAPL